MSHGAHGLKAHFRARWTALKARLLREQGCSAAEIGAALNCSTYSAWRYSTWDGNGPVFPEPKGRKR